VSSTEIGETQTIPVEAVEELTEDEERERHRLELKVERAFYEAGAALRELRERRLYRATHPGDFVGYCRDRFGKTKQAVNYLIAAVGVYENLTTTNCCRVLPTNEYQCRELGNLLPEEQPEVWQQIIEDNGGKVPSGRIVKSRVERFKELKERSLRTAPLPYTEGDVVKICRGGAELRRHLGYWGIVKNVGYTKCLVQITLKGEDVACKENEMRKLDASKTKLIREVSDRIANLARCNLDPAVWAILQTINQQEDITQIQLDLLAWAEERYGIRSHHS